MSKDRSEHYAFARGYYDARAEGVNRNPYTPDAAALSPEIDRLRAMYSDGYDWGITDYCAENHPEEVNK